VEFSLIDWGRPVLFDEDRQTTNHTHPQQGIKGVSMCVPPLKAMGFLLLFKASSLFTIELKKTNLMR